MEKEMAAVRHLTTQYRKNVDKSLALKEFTVRALSGGTTVRFVSRNMEQVRELCRRVLWLEKGHVRLLGEAGEVCAAYEG